MISSTSGFPAVRQRLWVGNPKRSEYSLSGTMAVNPEHPEAVGPNVFMTGIRKKESVRRGDATKSNFELAGPRRPRRVGKVLELRSGRERLIRTGVVVITVGGHGQE